MRPTQIRKKYELPFTTPLNEQQRVGWVDRSIPSTRHRKTRVIASLHPSALTPPASRPASPSPGRETWCREFRNCGTGRTRRRPATAAPRVGEPGGLGVARGVGDRDIQRLRNLVRHALAQRAGKLLRGLADQIGFANARKIFGKAGDAAEFRLAAGDPEDIAKGRQRMRGGIGIGALGVIDEQHVAAAADLLHAVRQPRKAAQAILQRLGADAGRQRASRGAGRILRIVQAAQRTDAAEFCDFAARAAGRLHDDFALDIDAVGQRVLHGDPHHALAGLIEPVGDVAAPAVVDADDRRALRLHAGDEARLHGRIVLDRAVAIDMVFADIEQNADGRIERGRKIDLVGRHLDHMHPTHPRRLQRQDRGADIAAHLGVVARDLHQMRDQRRGGRLAVGAGDGDERRVRRVTAALAAEQFDVADHLTAGLPRHQHRPMRRGMRQRRAGRQDQCRKIRPGHRAQIGGDEAGLRRLGDVVGAVVAGDHLRAARLQRVATRKTGTAEAEDRDRLARKGGDGDQGDHRSFSVERPASASITEMIQNRITICGSVQPFCSK